jgi:hypothetical protein
LLERIKDKEAILPVTDVQIVRRNAFEYIRYYIELGQSMGLIPKTVTGDGEVGTGQFKFVGDPETLKAVIKMLDAHEKRTAKKKNE